MGGGGSQTTKVEIPAWLEDAAKANLAKANTLSEIGYTPYYGPDVAALTPQQIASMQGTNTAAAAFGMPTADVTAGMPAATDYNGMSAYSSAPIYEQSLAELKAKAPGQYAALRAPFIDPVTGQLTGGGYGSGSASSAAAIPPAVAAEIAREGGGGGNASYGGGNAGRSTTSMATLGSYAPGGVNTNNPASLGNRMAASLSGPQGKPTAADRPISRSSAAGGGSGGMGGGK